MSIPLLFHQPPRLIIAHFTLSRSNASAWLSWPRNTSANSCAIHSESCLLCNCCCFDCGNKCSSAFSADSINELNSILPWCGRFIARRKHENNTLAFLICRAMADLSANATELTDESPFGDSRWAVVSDQLEIGITTVCVILGCAFNAECLWRSARDYRVNSVHASFQLVRIHLSIADLLVLCGYGVSQVVWMSTFWVEFGNLLCLWPSGTAATCCASWPHSSASSPSASRRTWWP